MYFAFVFGNRIDLFGGFGMHMHEMRFAFVFGNRILHLSAVQNP